MAIGYSAMYYADDRASGRTTYNTAIGYEAMKGSGTAANNIGQYNTSVGYQSLDAMTSADSNTVMGVGALGAATTGSRNVAIGMNAAAQSTTALGTVWIGTDAGNNAGLTGNYIGGIDNSNTATPLLYFDFANNYVNIINKLHIGASLASPHQDMTVAGDIDVADTVFTDHIVYQDTYYKDAICSALSLAPGVNAPSLRTLKNGVKTYGYAPSGQNDISYGQVQFNHDMKLGTDVDAHIHYSLEGATAAGDTVVVSLEYTWADFNEAFPTTDTIIVKIPVASKTTGVHYLEDFGDITGDGGDNVSSILCFTFIRLQDNVSDTYDDGDDFFLLLDIDFHYQVDSPGSNDETIK